MTDGPPILFPSLNLGLLFKAILMWGIFFFSSVDQAPAGASAMVGKGPGLVQGSGQEVLDFDTAVRLALKRSPFLQKSSLEIDVRRLDETDSRFAFVPGVTLRTRYYVNQPEQAGVRAEPYNLEFVFDEYNPVAAYFSLKARKLLTRIAILAHHQVISKGLHLLGQQFLELALVSRLITTQAEMITLAQKNQVYFQERLKLGETTSLEAQIAVRELTLARKEKERLISYQTRLKEGIRTFAGLKADQAIHVDLKAVTPQVLGSFEASAASLSEARARSFELQIQALMKELQGMRILLAKAKILPNLFMGVQSPDPLSSVSSRGLFFSVGLSWPVWDGFQRFRDISRQKTILKQIDTDLDLKEIDLSREWGEAMDKLGTAQAALELAQSQEELAHFKARQAEIRYQQEGQSFSSLAAARREYLEAQKNSQVKLLEWEQAQLLLRYLSGNLVYHYVAEKSWKN